MSMVIAYIASIVAVNVAFVHGPMLGPVPAATIIVGAVFVLRDYAQRRIGHWVLLAMLVGAALSYLMAGPVVAVASLLAFLAGELADWAIYTWTRRPFRDRVLLSSAVGTPIDSVVFLALMGFFSIAAFTVMVTSKMLAAVVIWAILRRAACEHGAQD